jgi:hypothetical protein
MDQKFMSHMPTYIGHEALRMAGQYIILLRQGKKNNFILQAGEL